jgi:hypothetical protein
MLIRYSPLNLKIIIKRRESPKKIRIILFDSAMKFMNDNDVSIRKRYIEIRNEIKMTVMSATQNKYLKEGTRRNFSKYDYALQRLR